MIKYILLAYLLSTGIQLLMYRWLSTAQGDIPPTIISKRDKLRYLYLSVFPVVNTITVIISLGAYLWFYSRIIKIHYDCFIIREKGKIDSAYIKKYGMDCFIRKQRLELDKLYDLTKQNDNL